MSETSSPVFATSEDLLRHIFSSKEVQQVETVQSGTEGLGGGQASSSEKVIIHFKDPEKDPPVHVFMKICRHGSQAAIFNTMLRTFDTEVGFYDGILKELSQYDENVCASYIPKFYGSGMVGKDTYLILEDFMRLGYSVVPSDHFFTDDQIMESLKFLGKFHAISFAKKVKGNFDWEMKFPFVLDDYVNKEGVDECLIKPFFSSKQIAYLDILAAVIKEKAEKNPTVKNIQIPTGVTENLLAEYKEMAQHNCKIMQACRKSTGSPGEVVAHGDFHMWNVAFKEEGEDFSMKVFDYQGVTYSSYASDLHQFLSQTCDAKTRTQKLQDYLTCYSKAVNETGQALGLSKEDLKCFEVDEIIQEYKRKSPLGFIFGFTCVLGRFIRDNEAFERTQKSKDSSTIVKELDNSSPDIWQSIQMYFDIMQEHVELDTLATMKSTI